MEHPTKSVGPAALVLLTILAWQAAPLSAAKGAKPDAPERHLLYVVAPGIRDYLEFGGAGIFVFDMDRGHAFLKRIETPASARSKPENIKGVCANAATGRLYFSTPTRLYCLDLKTEKVIWEKALPGGCDRMSLTPDGSRLYVPSFEGPHWNIVDGATGEAVAKIETKSGAHNTVVDLGGTRAYLAGLKSPVLTVIDVQTQKVVGSVGPFTAAIRPFTVNAAGTLCFVNVNDLLGFEIGNLKTGKKLHRVEVKGFEKGPIKRHGCPSHGIGLTPDEKEVWVCDAANSRVHVFDATEMPPKQIASIKLREQPGWVTFSLDGRHAYPSTGEVVETKTKKIIAALKDEKGREVHSEKVVEVVFRGGAPVRAGDQFGLGRAPTTDKPEPARKAPTQALTPIPDKLVVLTFDDSAKSHFTVARPLLKRLGFGATFFITEGFDFPTNKRDYMTWAEIAQLHEDGFEIGNHTRDHKGVTRDTIRDLAAQLRGINVQCEKHGVPVPTSFAYPGNAIERDAVPVLGDLGIQFARRGGAPEHPYKQGNGFAYEPGLDHPLLIPSAGDARPGWTLDDFKRAVGQARHGKIAILQFHGVPDTAHDWVTTSRKQFEEYMKYLAENKFQVIALRDLAKYVDPTVTPIDPWGAIQDRQRLLEMKRAGDNARPAANDADLRRWLENMAVHHKFAPSEMGAALGLTAEEVAAALDRLGIDPKQPPRRAPDGPLLVLPYPGGRHPRAGFLDGAIRPQREAKISIFAPWSDGGYAVADMPEAIWFETEGKRELLYLAHTHVPTVWDRRGISLEAREWKSNRDGSLEIERRLPNKVTFGATAVPGRDGVRMEMWVSNGSEAKLTGLQVQMCVMLKGLVGFDSRTNDNKVFAKPFAACRDQTSRRWVIAGWEPCVRAWGNPPCPCLHADPQVPDCPTKGIQRIRGWISFYEGDDINGELRRLRAHAFGGALR